MTAASPVSTPPRALDARAPSAADRVDQLEGGPDGALGVVLVGDRGAPDGHDGITDELLDRAAVALDDLAGKVEVAAEELAHRLRVRLLGERREADEVGEEDVTRRRSATGAGRGTGRPGRAAPASAGGARTDGGEQGRALAAELLAGLIRRRRRRAGDGERARRTRSRTSAPRGSRCRSCRRSSRPPVEPEG